SWSLFFLTVLVASGVGNLGVGLGNVYFLNKGDHRFEELLSGSLFLFATTTAITAAVVVFIGAVFGSDALVSGRAFWMYAAAIPALIAYLLLTSFLHGRSRFLALSALATLQGLVTIAAAGALWASGHLSLFSAIAAWVAGFIVADIVALPLIGLRHLRWRLVLRPPWHVLREQIKYGSQGQLANLAQLFNYRLDQYLVAAFVTRAGVGHYTVAVGLAESIWWLSSAIAMALLPRLTAMDREDAGDFTPIVCRNTLLISAAAAAVLMAASPLLIRGVFGDEFSPAVAALLLLMPGIIAASAARILGSYLFSQGKVIYNTYATAIALAVTLALDLTLIPPLGINGAALASSVAYVAALLATLYWYRRTSGNPLREALFVRRSDTRLYAALWRRLRGAGRASLPGETAL
ncbi:MAG TPA: polysaccharide biosynthesis C-terminal domain-containing protein, partial [Dehalococcoidia bacterium]|nr:polysaccharide biosynthesis C-terminal domain-containing protein [Dehalococcoidia bacterium]